MEDLAPRMGARHCDERLGSVEAGRVVTQGPEEMQISARPAPQIENGVGGTPSIASSNAAVFWLTSWSRVPSQ